MDVDLPLVVLAVHVLVGLVFVALGVQNAIAGRPLGLALQGLIGVLIIGTGVAAARVFGDYTGG